MNRQALPRWRSGSGEVRENLASPAVQAVETIQGDMPRRLPDLNRTAERLYRRWMVNLKS